jgi:hypothetical protein
VGLLFNPITELRVFTAAQMYTIRGLDTDFDILARRDSKPNTAQITVYQLSETARNLFTAEHQGVEFFAGYGDKPVLIFRGTTTNILHTKAESGTEWATEIYAGEGEKELQTSVFNRSYTAGTEIRLIIEDVARSMGLPIEIDFFEIPQSLLKGVSLSGMAKDVLDQLTQDYNLRWSIQQGQLEVTDLLSPISSQATAVVLSSDTGMLGSPVLTERQPTGKRKKKKDDKIEMIPGVKVRSLMNPDIRPNRLVEIRARQTINNQLGKLMETKRASKSANGLYIADKVRYTGNNYGGPFVTEMEADKTAA